MSSSPPQGAWVLADAIDSDRLRAEQVPVGLEIETFAWDRPEDRHAFVADAASGRRVASDVPTGGQHPVPDELTAAKRRLQPDEVERYRSLGRDAAEAMTEALAQATPEMTELELAGVGSAALHRRGIEPALVLVGGARRVEIFRHPKAGAEPIGPHAMVVFCGRRAGLYANLTRHVYFREPTADERARDEAVAQVEAVALDASTPGATLGEIYEAITAAYRRHGFPDAARWHHQGGITGYLSREALATPTSRLALEPTVALAWNPSLPGAKIEDTVLRHADGIEILTADPAWPSREVGGRLRPDLLVRR